MKSIKKILAISLSAISMSASAASDVVAVSQPDAVIFQSQVSSAVQLSATVSSGLATAAVTGPIAPTSSISMSGNTPTVTSTISSITAPTITASGFASSSALVTQDALGLIVIPEGTVLTSPE